MVPNRRRKLRPPSDVDVVIGEASAVHLGHDQPLVVGRDRNAIGKPQSLGDNAHRAVGRHQNDAADGASIRRRRQIETEVSDIGAAQAVDDHVVDRAGRDSRQVGVERKLAVLVSQQALLEHRQHDQPAVRQDAEAAGRVAIDLGVLFAFARGREAQQRPFHAVDEPEPARVPARPFEITSPVEHGFWLG